MNHNMAMLYNYAKRTRNFWGVIILILLLAFYVLGGVFNKNNYSTCMIITNSSLRASLIIYRLISNARSCNNCWINHIHNISKFRQCSQVHRRPKYWLSTKSQVHVIYLCFVIIWAIFVALASCRKEVKDVCPLSFDLQSLARHCLIARSSAE